MASMFRIGDLVQRVGPHTVNGSDVGDRESRVGHIGAITKVSEKTNIVYVRWIHDGSESAIDANSVALTTNPFTVTTEGYLPLQAAFESGFSAGVFFSKGSVENSESYTLAQGVGFEVFRRSLK